MLSKDYCKFLGRLRVYLDDKEVGTIFCSKPMADQIFETMQELQRKILEKKSEQAC